MRAARNGATSGGFAKRGAPWLILLAAAALATGGIAIGIPAALALRHISARCFTAWNLSIFRRSCAPFWYWLYLQPLRELCRRYGKAGRIRCPPSDANNGERLRQRPWVCSANRPAALQNSAIHGRYCVRAERQNHARDTRTHN